MPADYVTFSIPQSSLHVFLPLLLQPRFLDPSRSATVKAQPFGRGFDAFYDSAKPLSRGLDVSSPITVLDRIDSKGNGAWPVMELF